MKTMKAIILVLALAMTACEIVAVDEDQDGDSFLGSVFEVEGDFTPGNNWMLYYEFPDDFDVYESDIVLVYILWEQLTGSNGKVTDVWRLLPQTVILDEGVLQYNFDYTISDVQIFLDGSINLNTLLPAESQDQVFRIVVLPAEFAINTSLDVSDYNLVAKNLGLDLNKPLKMEVVNKLHAAPRKESSGE